MDICNKKDSMTTNPNKSQPIVKKCNKYLILNIVGLLLMLFIITGLGFVFRFGSTKSTDKSCDCDQNVQSSKNSSVEATVSHLVNKLHFVTRDEWIAQTSKTNLTKLKLPVNRVIITHTATEECEKQSQCVSRVQQIQKHNMKWKKWDDIGINFLVGGDGAVYEGRGWDFQGAHTFGYNSGSIGISFIGSFTKSAPPQRQFDALKVILEEGIRLGKVTKDYKMYPHCAFSSTESPGDALLKVIKQWPHFVDHLV